MGWVIFIIGALGWHIGVYGMFKKAGIAPWKAFIPFYNTWCMVQLCEIKKVWFWLQFIPIAGQFISIWILIIFVMHFGKFTFLEHAAAVFLPFIYLPYLGYSKDVRWGGKEVVARYKKSVIREWVDAAVFAIVAATLIRTFIFEAYTIPSESMEKTLLVNDFLFVNKMIYGRRLPITPISFPFVHNTLPGMPTSPSYVKWVQLKYERIGGESAVQRNDVVVFNVPVGDTIINLPEYGSKNPYYDVLRQQYHDNRDALNADFPLLVHPLDKTDNYIKRCVGVPGDNLVVRNGRLYVNNRAAFLPPYSQIDYLVETDGNLFSEEFFNEELGIDLNDPKGQIDIYPEKPNTYLINMTPVELEKVKKQANVKNVEIFQLNIQGITFPYNEKYFPWTPDNYGPIHIPKKGEVITISARNLALYQRLITNYEGNTLEQKDGKFYINGTQTNVYKTKYNYYWMMGDNRHRSQDSRFWGFVPETHIVGKASLIWFSWQNGPRWQRLFNSIK